MFGQVYFGAFYFGTAYFGLNFILGPSQEQDFGGWVYVRNFWPDNHYNPVHEAASRLGYKGGIASGISRRNKNV